MVQDRVRLDLGPDVEANRSRTGFARSGKFLQDLENGRPGVVGRQQNRAIAFRAREVRVDSGVQQGFDVVWKIVDSICGKLELKELYVIKTVIDSNIKNTEVEFGNTVPPCKLYVQT